MIALSRIGGGLKSEAPSGVGMKVASRISSVFGRAGTGLLDLAFPRRCAGCGAYGSFFCDACWRRAEEAREPRCTLCWMPALSVRTCERCTVQKPAFKGARSPFVYRGPIQRAVHAFKYEHVSALAPCLAEPMARCLAAWNPPVELLIPVPMTARRKRLRGFNQAELLAKEIAVQAGLPLVTAALARKRDGASQATSTGEGVRQANVAGAFRARSENVLGRAVLIVDDVMTSGATLDACAAALREAGAEAVYALTLARED